MGLERGAERETAVLWLKLVDVGVGNVAVTERLLDQCYLRGGDELGWLDTLPSFVHLRAFYGIKIWEGLLAFLLR